MVNGLIQNQFVKVRWVYQSQKTDVRVAIYNSESKVSMEVYITDLEYC